MYNQFLYIKVSFQSKKIGKFINVVDIIREISTTNADKFIKIVETSCLSMELEKRRIGFKNSCFSSSHLTEFAKL